MGWHRYIRRHDTQGAGVAVHRLSVRPLRPAECAENHVRREHGAQHRSRLSDAERKRRDMASDSSVVRERVSAGGADARRPVAHTQPGAARTPAKRYRAQSGDYARLPPAWAYGYHTSDGYDPARQARYSCAPDSMPSASYRPCVFALRPQAKSTQGRTSSETLRRARSMCTGRPFC